MNRDRVPWHDPRRATGGAQHLLVELPPVEAHLIANTLHAWSAEKARNVLAAIKEPGYGEFPQIDTAGRLDAVFEASSYVGAEIQKRMDAAHILPMAEIVKAWPEVERRVLADREKAKVDDLLPTDVPRVPARASSKAAQRATAEKNAASAAAAASIVQARGAQQMQVGAP